jgi:alpha-glucosidase
MNRSAAALVFVLSVVGALPALGTSTDPGAFPVESPDGNVRLTLLLRTQMQFSLSFKGATVVEQSPISLTVDGVGLATNASRSGAPVRSTADETYASRGVHSRARNHYNAIAVPFKNPTSGTAFTVELRAFDDGAAFRFVVPRDKDKQSRVPDEATTFTLPAGSTVWYHDLAGHYEGVHARRDVGDVKIGDWAAPPVTFKLPGGRGYASITEAALRNYSGMALRADGARGFTVALGHKHPLNRPFQLRYGEDEHKRLSNPAAIAGEIVTPWRVVLVGSDLNALVNSDVLHDLCPPPDPELFPQGLATEWVKPGRAVWKYLDGGQNTLEEMKAFSRWAGELGFEYHVIEGFWSKWSDQELKELVDDARQHHVGIWLWRNTKELRTPEARAAFFARCEKAGAVGVKLDFFDHEAKEVVDLYETLLRDAARHKLMVNFHGADKPTGLDRTWPNELTREAVRGMESSRLQQRARHDVTLPFTRFLVGGADYTPVHFGPRRGDTTWAHQVASAAAFTSPLLTYGAYPKKLLENPAVGMIRSVPATWDETAVLPVSEIGEIAAFARRKGDTWFLAILNGPEARNVSVPLSFLGDRAYSSLVVRDAADAGQLDVETSRAARGDTIEAHLAAGGGFIARFSPAN